MDIEHARTLVQAYNVIWQSVHYDPARVVSVYARRQGAIEVRFEEVDIKGKSIRTSWTKLGQMPVEWADMKAAPDGTSNHLMAGMTLQERKDAIRDKGRGQS